MANYCAATRTNYFRVKDEEKFRDIVHACVAEDELKIFERAEPTGDRLFGLGCEGTISGVEDSEDDDYPDYSYDAFTSALQEVIPEGEAIIIMEARHEKLRYVVGYASVITKTEIKSVDMERDAIKLARGMLNNPDFCTITEY